MTASSMSSRSLRRLASAASSCSSACTSLTDEVPCRRSLSRVIRASTTATSDSIRPSSICASSSDPTARPASRAARLGSRPARPPRRPRAGARSGARAAGGGCRALQLEQQCLVFGSGFQRHGVRSVIGGRCLVRRSRSPTDRCAVRSPSRSRREAPCAAGPPPRRARAIRWPSATRRSARGRRRPRVLAGLGCRMVAQIARDVDIRGEHVGARKQRVARSRAQGDGGHRAVVLARDPHSPRRRAAAAPRGGARDARASWARQATDAAEARCRVGSGSIGRMSTRPSSAATRADVPSATTSAFVCAASRAQPDRMSRREDGALVAVLGDVVTPRSRSGMVHDQQLRSRPDRLIDGVEHGVDGEMDAVDLGAGSPEISPGASHDSAPESGHSP